MAAASYTRTPLVQSKRSLVSLLWSHCTRPISGLMKTHNLWQCGIIFSFSAFLILFIITVVSTTAQTPQWNSRANVETESGGLLYSGMNTLRDGMNKATLYVNFQLWHKPLPKPTAFLLGQQKSGTSSLALSFINHPDLVWPIEIEGDKFQYGRKELHFFYKPENFNLGIERYKSHWPDPLPTEQAYYIEATPYLNVRRAVDNMFAAYGEDAFTQLKFVVILRNPTQRHVSWFNHLQVKRDMAEYGKLVHDLNADVASYISEEPMSVAEFVASCGHNACFEKNRLLMGAYAGQLEMWLDAGARPEQFEVIFLEEYLAGAAGVLRRVTDFLGIREAVIAETAGEDAASDDVEAESKNRSEHLQELTPENEALLNQYYAPWNCRLAELLDRTGIRSWEDARAGAGSWFPARDDC